MRARKPSKTSKHERGVALLMVVLAIAILTAVATDFTYNSRVDLELATNQRDELQAYYLAESGVGMSRLLLRFQHQLDGMQLPNLGGLLGGLMGGAAGGAAGAPAPTGLNIQLWKLAHVDCHMLQGLVPPVDKNNAAGPGPGFRAQSRGGAKSRASPSSSATRYEDAFPELAAKQDQMSFGGFNGCFNTKIEDEEEKLNVNQLDATQLTAQAAGLRLLALFGDKRFDFVFNPEESPPEKVTPQDVLINLRDWIDADQVQSALNLTGTGDLFAPGFSSESTPYDRTNPKYQPKNGRFDSLDELYMVGGVNDRFMAAFRDRLTVYPDINAALNINSDDPMMLYMAILSVADPLRPDPRLKDPVFLESIIDRIRQARMLSFFGMSVADFIAIVQSSGIAVNSGIMASTSQPNRWVSDKSSTFRIKVTGEAGHVQRTIETVVRLDNGLGTLLYWKEG